eukprot:499065-Rhodomonas_salina.1
MEAEQFPPTRNSYPSMLALLQNFFELSSGYPGYQGTRVPGYPGATQKLQQKPQTTRPSFPSGSGCPAPGGRGRRFTTRYKTISTPPATGTSSIGAYPGTESSRCTHLVRGHNFTSFLEWGTAREKL